MLFVRKHTLIRPPAPHWSTGKNNGRAAKYAIVSSRRAIVKSSHEDVNRQLSFVTFVWIAIVSGYGMLRSPLPGHEAEQRDAPANQLLASSGSFLLPLIYSFPPSAHAVLGPCHSRRMTQRLAASQLRP
ncbi:hypothetical protein PCANC_07382 [Puccinia coronata f. sp. avenae]|uniref:Uncharacterized protein n=1 Tax=Puccinia coronata f. sp. avenae TaxID=200324 RepID=A0A2N5S8N6_9BASI|nr:hypothetical protein PCASD_20251 [Puccinia coronata f. sp. avenae]PLW20684.1 hypothetical protein PCANC_07382 [Puccinia coronata f. sp. avenae]